MFVYSSQYLVVVLRHLKEIHPDLSKVSIRYQSNGSIYPSDEVLKLWEDYKFIVYGASLDGVGERFNYLRHFGVWDVVKENIKIWQNKVKETKNEKINFEVCCTISILNVLYVFEMVDFVIENQLKLMKKSRSRSPPRSSSSEDDRPRRPLRR